MARSYKKTPGWCDRNPWMKRYANKRIRQLFRRGGEIPNGGRYKRLTEQWNICDWRYLIFSERELAELDDPTNWTSRVGGKYGRYKATRK